MIPCDWLSNRTADRRVSQSPLSESEWLSRARPLLLEDNFLQNNSEGIHGSEVVLLLEGCATAATAAYVRFSAGN